MPELLRSAKLAVEKGQAQGQNESYVKQLSDYIIPSLVDALHKGKDRTAEEKRIAICIFDDVAEHCRDAAVKRVELLVYRYLIELGQKALVPEFAKIMQQGYAHLPGGICMSAMGRHITYEQAVAWKVLAADESIVHCLAFSFVNWSFV
ncbi:hypothetical protein L1987_34759 [Smallanthus sonchifolius]|uniref:Uncharacterized protein n=1 Tax=Smallanthus sonchifolius TaxID=185202 RepID=A0ACB9HVH2_9ASTR|nr:hypothetical protein L1987_34759 [Smallanthus sonchifolius]